ncbi:hypothetical protein KSP40_PGU017554 [Platanthera guangdongensis]|uniref:Uncharacterized protein n=1 Tax=Platanthera guangdongensis TaxID=2320717 RepID=A0ABR2MBA8_9ASPA
MRSRLGKGDDISREASSLSRGIDVTPVDGIKRRFHRLEREGSFSTGELAAHGWDGIAEVAKVVEIQASLVRQLELIETHQQELPFFSSPIHCAFSFDAVMEVVGMASA